MTSRAATRLAFAPLAAWALLAAIAAWLPLDARAVRQGGVLAVLHAPGGGHPLGTDEVGRDVLAVLVLGARASLLLCLLAAALAGVVGGALGILAARRGVLGRALEVVVDAFLALPALAWALVARGLAGDRGVVGLALVLGLAQAPAVARLVAGELARLHAAPFVEATRAIGAGPRALARALWPHLAPTLALAIATTAAGTVLAEAVLAFLGIGLDAPSWGGLVRQAHAHGLRWWLAAPPVGALLVVVLALQALADVYSSRQAPRAA